MDPSTAEQLDLTGGFSNSTLLIISLTGFTIMFALLAFLCHVSPASNADVDGNGDEDGDMSYDKLLQEADVSTLNRAQRRARAKLLMKKSRRLVTTADSQARDGQDQDGGQGQGQEGADANDAQQQIIALGGNHEDDGDENQESESVSRTPQPSRKERQKAAKELERAERKANEEQRKLQMIYEKEQRLLKEKHMKEARERLELEKRERAERDFIEWKYMFPPSHDEDGHCRHEHGDYGVSVKEFIEELQQTNQILCLSETADRFSVSIDRLIRRIKQLEDDGRILHGILNRENDTYILVTADLFRKMKGFIEAKGSVSVEEIATELERAIHSD